MALRLVLFEPGPKLGALLEDGRVVDLAAAHAALLGEGDSSEKRARAQALFPPALSSFIASGEEGLEQARRVLDALGKGTDANYIHRLGQVRLLPPLPSLCSKLVCAAVNFASHTARVRRMTEEQARRWVLGQLPGAFLKLPHVLVGPYDDVVYPARTTKLDYEVEVAALVSQRCRDVPKDRAGEFIYGYSVFIDYSLRDDQDPKETLSLPMRKNFDTGASLGPCIVPKQEVQDVYALRMELRVNGQLRQRGSTAEMIRSFEELLSWFSRDLTFFPGDVLTSGTCEGTALERELEADDASWYLRPGDVVEAEVERLGLIRNRIVKASPGASGRREDGRRGP